jgi:hypothetical protein
VTAFLEQVALLNRLVEQDPEGARAAAKAGSRIRLDRSSGAARSRSRVAALACALRRRQAAVKPDAEPPGEAATRKA